jgi:hypothetical protein
MEGLSRGVGHGIGQIVTHVIGVTFYTAESHGSFVLTIGIYPSVSRALSLNS